MSDLPVVADAGPLIGLARAGLLNLLRQLYGKILIPAQVLAELHLAGERPGSRSLLAAMKEGWLAAASLSTAGDLALLSQSLDPGEAEAILLAEQCRCRFLLIDERRARNAARRRRLQISGTGAVLVAAKRAGLLSRVSEALNRLSEAGYRLSAELRREILILAGEDEP